MEYRTAVAIKKGLKCYANPIAIDVENYLDLVKRSKMFIDTSLLISIVVHYTNQYLVLVAPPKWGKTMNADMIKTFLEIQVDEEGREIPKSQTNSYRLFRKGEIIVDNGTVEKLENPLLISQHPAIMDDYLGRVPIIHISFKGEMLHDRITVEQRLANIVKRAYEQHKYLMKGIQRKIYEGKPHEREYAKFNMKIYERMLSDEAEEHKKFEVKKPIIELCRLLYEHFNKKVFIIIDSYDGPFMDALQDTKSGSDHISLMTSAVDYFVGDSFVENYYLDTGIIMGITDFRKPGIFNTWGYNLFDCTIKERPLCEYFGFTEPTVHSLFDRLNITDEQRDQAQKWYNGFQSRITSERFYNPYSIAKFANKKVVASYSTAHMDRKIAAKFHPIYLRELFLLFSGQSVKINNEPTIGVIEAFSLMNGESTESLLQYLFRNGYLSVPAFGDSLENTDSSGYCWQRLAHLPNFEAAYDISDWIISSYQRTYNLNQHLLDEAASNLLDVVTNDSSNTTQLDKSMQIIFKHCSAYVDSKNEIKKNTTVPRHFLKLRRQNFYYYLFYCVALKMQRESGFELYVFYRNETEPNVVVYNATALKATIIELDYGSTSPTIALERALQYNNTLNKLEGIEMAKIIGMSISLCRIVRSAMKFVKIMQDDDEYD